MKDAVVLGPMHDRLARLEHDKNRLLEALRNLYDVHNCTTILPIPPWKKAAVEGAMWRAIKLLKELEK